MASNLFERLAESEVPPPPAQFDTQLHDRVNRRLIETQVVDLILCGLPWAFLHFARALVGLIAFTLTGRYEKSTKYKRR
ncbi:MAG: hypothetical protein HY288_13310 [Planctomycetia bacterium]|nr:hypothetical protein [Planctomycetia bacterium]